jgi:lysozyme family protein
MSVSFPCTLTLKHEGGFCDHKLDPGGATTRGVS